MSTGEVINLVLWAVIIGWGIYELIQYYKRKNAAKELTQEEFKQSMRKAQIIDVREKADFDAGHILGARNIPYSTLKARMAEIRKDQPVYLYDYRKALSDRAAVTLRKAGYTDLYRLKGGYREWTGKTKQKAR